MRGVNRTEAAAPRLSAPAAHEIEREVADIKQNERRTQDSLEAVHGTVEHVIDRLATIESGLYGGADARPALASAAAAAAEPAAPRLPADAAPLTAPADAAAPPALLASAPADRQPGRVRPPIDPSLPPDHPLEPGSGAGHARLSPSAAERIAASEAAIGSASPPVISDSGRPNFIEAARRAAQAAAWEASSNKAEAGSKEKENGSSSNKLSQRLRKLIVAGGAVLIVLGCVRIATRLLDGGPAVLAPAQSGQLAPASEAEQAAIPANRAGDGSQPLPLLKPAPDARPAAVPASKAAKPARQSMSHDVEGPEVVAVPPVPSREPGGNATALWTSPDITGALPQHNVGSDPAPAADMAVVIDDKLPAGIGDPALRAAAMSGDPAAAYEVAMRFAESRGVTQNNEAAARWLERAAKEGLAMAQFRLGGFYEKGIGVKKNLAMARDLYRAAAEQGNGKATHNLAVLYAEGIEGPPDYHNAAIWFRKAADHGIEDSQYNLGILYVRGIGVQRNQAESYKWFALAAKQGDREAAKKRDEVAAQLDQQSLAAARAAVERWSPQPQPEAAISVKIPAPWNAPEKRPHASRSRPRLSSSALNAD